MPLHIETPLVTSRPLSLAAGRQVTLKLEALQPPGSFKIRGMGAACEWHASRGKRRFVSSSGGNAGIAAAYAGRELGIAVTVVVPETSTAHARELIRQQNAELIVHGKAWHEANALAMSLLTEHDAFLHPFDDPLLWTGHATMIDEAVRQGDRPDAVLLSVGGGGLMAGVVEGLRRNGWGDVSVIAVETIGADSLNQAAQAGERIALDAITSIATSLGAKQVCEQAFSLLQSHPVRCVTVTDQAALAACERFLDDHRILVEPACGASLVLAYANAPALANFQNVMVIVCGGATATVDQLRAWRTS
ncbi:pyridoxal-phosphate dependent enzyme [Ideonella azotifigens]|uniref:L-serine ammonia-lyase n=1 Tax=Ideonella azotifigens TaxID=513160 RepID=A0ABN1KD06_9BURK|nr:pyridoxal-phosphate dependent enzyme [Ideonella azotifigens]MCD2343689.1 pyridoxal-phosphate dependent enzyme [Ideonella azotifigens]